MLREIHKHTDTQPPVLSHPHITKQTQQGLTLSRRPPTQNRTLTHTSYTPRHTWPCPRDGHAVWRNTASDKSEVYIHMQAHTQTHADSFRTGASIHGNPQIQPCQVGTDTSSQPRYPPYTHTHISSTKRAAEAFAHRSRAHRHTPQRHSYRHQPYTHKHGHSNIRPEVFANGSQRPTNLGALTHIHRLTVTFHPHRNTGNPGLCLPGANVYKLLFLAPPQGFLP